MTASSIIDLDAPLATAAVLPNFTPDPYPNIFWRNTLTGENGVWQITPTTTGTATVQGFAITPVPPSSGWEVAGLFDLNFDGNTDILWRNSVTGENGYWVMNGLSISQVGLLPPVPIATGWNIAGVADFSSDGIEDILWRNSITGESGIWRLAATAEGPSLAGVIPLPTIPTNSGWEVAGVGDLAGSPDADLLWRNGITGETAVWMMNGPSISTILALPTIAPNSGWDVAGIADFNLDGLGDIVWRNSITGDNAIWLLGATTSGSAVLSVSVASILNLPNVAKSTGWEIVGVAPDFGGPSSNT